MKGLIFLPLLILPFNPTKASVRKDIHNLCISAVDYLGCVEAMSGTTNDNFESLSETYERLRKLSSRTGVGLNKEQFSNLWGENAFYLEEEIKKRSGKTKLILQDTYDKYKDIQEFWNCIFKTQYASLMTGYCLSYEFQVRNPEIISFLADYVGRSSEVTYIVNQLMTKASVQVETLGQHLKTLNN